MKLVTYIDSLEQFNQFIQQSNVDLNFEVILSCQELSRYTKTTHAELLVLLNLAQKNRIEVVLEWDVLYQEEKFAVACDFLDRLPLHDFKAIRLQDPGAVHYIKTKYSWLPIQLILENGNHNLVGLLKWSEYLGSQCERLVLSNELSKEMLKQYATTLKVPLEVLCFGRILLFYAPRFLLSPLDKEREIKSYLEASGSSEESPHSGFPIIENRHGTFMFNVKDLYLLDHLDELESIGIGHARVDLRFDQYFKQHLSAVIDLFSKRQLESELNLKSGGVRPFIKGFYNVNKTDVLFTKLKNKRTQRRDQFYIGEVVDVERDSQIALLVKTDHWSTIKDQSLKLITPEGKEKVVIPHWVKTSQGTEILTAKKHDLILIPYVNGVTVKTQIYLNNPT
ncbi:MAG: U32 family peptidase [Bacteriovorax sp.]|nr:U32 family peptidase [Bacteriovorax sp.]